MSYTALYRELRPQVFEDVVEQEHVVKTLRYSVKTGRIAHAYLFCGTRGTGKTTMAQIFSRAINCLNPHDGDPCNECEICKGILSGNILDVLEIDAASNNSVDNVREIRDEVIYAPSAAKYKVYIIDEVHMLSTGAFNALLKTLEEPPSHVVFILATTEPHKLPATILSRCQRFDFRKISLGSIAERLDKVARMKRVSFDKEALMLIARLADGALRDALSIMDQCMSQGSTHVTYEDVMAVAGIVNNAFISDFVEAVIKSDITRILKMIDELDMSGKDPAQFVSDLVYYYRNLLICTISENAEELIDASAEILERMKRQSGIMDRETIINSIKELSLLEANMKRAAHPRILLEVTVIKICEGIFTTADDNINDRLSALERKLDQLAAAPVLTAPVKSVKAESSDAARASGFPEAAEAQVSSVPYSAKESAKPFNSEDPGVDYSQKDPATTQSSVNYLEFWDDVIKELKKADKMALFSNLTDTKAVDLGNKHIAIVFKSNRGFNKMYVSRLENIDTLQGILKKKLGHEVRIKCIDEEDVQENKTVPSGKEMDDFTQKAVKLAEKLDAPYNVIDK